MNANVLTQLTSFIRSFSKRPDFQNRNETCTHIILKIICNSSVYHPIRMIFEVVAWYSPYYLRREPRATLALHLHPLEWQRPKKSCSIIIKIIIAVLAGYRTRCNLVQPKPLWGGPDPQNFPSAKLVPKRNLFRLQINFFRGWSTLVTRHIFLSNHL